MIKKKSTKAKSSSTHSGLVREDTGTSSPDGQRERADRDAPISEQDHSRNPKGGFDDETSKKRPQLVTQDFVSPRRVLDPKEVEFRRLMEEAKARGALQGAALMTKVLNALLDCLLALDELDALARGEKQVERGLEIATDEWGSSSLMLPGSIGFRGIMHSEQAMGFLLRCIVEVSGSENPPSKTEEDVLDRQQTFYMRRDDFAKQFAEVAPYLNEKQLEAILERARHDARIGRFLAEINASNTRPALYRDKPGWMSLPEFLRTEWLAKGWLRDDVDRQMVGAYDDGLLRGVINFEANHGRLPDELQFKVLRERQARADAQPKSSKVLKK